MLCLLLDQDFNHDIIRGLVLRIPDLDFITALSLGLERADDRRLLLAAARERRILLSHDELSMAGHYWALLNKGKTLEGVVIVPRRLPIRSAVDDLETIVNCSTHEDWTNNCKILPL